MLGVGILLAEGENEFFYGLETAPAHAEDRLNDAWLQGLETADVPMVSETGDGGSPPASASKKDVNKPLKVAMEAMTRGFEKYSELEMPATNKECHHNTRIVPEEPVNGLEENVNFAALVRYKWIIARVRSYGMKVMQTLFHHSLPPWADIVFLGHLGKDDLISGFRFRFQLTSEEEIARLLNCADHFSVLGLSRYENVDVSVLKREYRKTAMQVHPDKNMSNEKAAEAFKKLQNAYENGERGFFASWFAHSEAEGDDPFGESRQIACKRCGNFHLLVHSKKSKSQARWCQDCKKFHQAKDGDGWVEQSSQPFLFGLLQKVAPTAYVCADSKIHDATDWYICQGMRCPANSHKPSFHLNTSITAKHNTSKGSSSGQRSGRMPTPNMEETMTEEELFEWLQKAVQAGEFDNYSSGTSNESPSAKAGNGPKSGGGGSSSGNKRKKKGKKQW
uniref:J domain-containing protein n=1 Tax=Populus alba TaxID=43335 RepID=A0A4U5Q0I2_POPAL|nr:hypothetical protein D5086_0000158020 [Populus alba]